MRVKKYLKPLKWKCRAPVYSLLVASMQNVLVAHGRRSGFSLGLGLMGFVLVAYLTKKSQNGGSTARLETRTKEFNMYASTGVFEAHVRNESNISLWLDPQGAQSAGHNPSGERSECEHIC